MCCCRPVLFCCPLRCRSATGAGSSVSPRAVDCYYFLRNMFRIFQPSPDHPFATVSDRPCTTIMFFYNTKSVLISLIRTLVLAKFIVYIDRDRSPPSSDYATPTWTSAIDHRTLFWTSPRMPTGPAGLHIDDSDLYALDGKLDCLLALPSRDGDPAHRLAAFSRRPPGSPGAAVVGRRESPAAIPAAKLGPVSGGWLQPRLWQPAADRTPPQPAAPPTVRIPRRSRHLQHRVALRGVRRRVGAKSDCAQEPSGSSNSAGPCRAARCPARVPLV